MKIIKTNYKGGVSMSVFDKAFEDTIIIEGGYADDPLDRGGKTKYGVTESLARRYGYEGDMKDLSIDFAKMVYKKEFWDKMRLDEIESDKLKRLIFDAGINHGQGRAVRFAQKAYNTLSERTITVDGIIGSQTINAVNSYPYELDLAYWYVAIRSNYFKAIVDNDDSQKRFIRGWGRRVQHLLKDIVFK